MVVMGFNRRRIIFNLIFGLLGIFFTLNVFAYDFIVDDQDATLSGDWKSSTYHDNFYGENYLAADVGNGSSAITWSTELPATGDYEIFYWLPEGYKNRPSAAQYVISSNDGVQKVSVDQRAANGEWISLGIYQCAKGSSCVVSLSNEVSNGSYVNADAIKFVPTFDYQPLENLALNKQAVGSTTYGSYSAAKAVDGVISDSSRWLSNGTNDWIKVNLGKEYNIQCVHLYNGWQESQSGISNFKLQYYTGSAWADIPGTSYENNAKLQLRIVFDKTIYTKHIRLISTDSEMLKIKELEVYGVNGYDSCPRLPKGGDIPDILVNQSGYNLKGIKRFTAPTLDDGTAFSIHKENATQTLYSGEIIDHVGDFSDFNPTDSASNYVISAGDLESDAFGVGPYWYQRVSYDNLMRFMIDARCYVGTDNSCLRGVVYRDDHAYSFEMSSLIAMYFANPSYHENRPRSVEYVAGYGPLSAPAEDAPDIVKLIHFVADRLMGEGVKQAFLKAQLAQFLYIYPYVSQWIDQADYQAVLAYLVPIWDQNGTLYSGDGEAIFNILGNQNLLAVVTDIGGYKGNLPPGYAIKANLMMYQVALREGLDDPEQYFNAAYAQTQWLIDNVAWNSKNTKGQRMSEHITMEGLHYFLKMYPQRAPAGLKAKIQAWADRAIAMSDNMWDFRRFSDEYWVIPDDYNEPGNVAGLPAALNAAVEFVDAQSAKRLKELSAAHLDAVFGRNPTGRHFSYTAAADFEGVERGYYAEYSGGLGQLSGIAGKLDGSAKEDHFPYYPGVGQVGRVEAWVAFNTAWNAAVAYHDYDETTVTASYADGQIKVSVAAPLNLNYNQIETGYAYVTCSNGDVEKVLITEASKNAMTFVGEISVETGDANAGDGVLQVNAGDRVEVSYGYDFLKNSKTLTF